MTGHGTGMRFRPLLMAVVAGGFIATACFVTPAQAQKTDDPRISVSPSKIEFGGVSIGETKTKAAKIRNRGSADLEISAITPCADTSAEFSFSPPGAVTLAPKETMNLEVIYAPVDAGSDRGCLTIASNDPKHPTVDVSLRGRGVDDAPTSDGPDIDLKPDSLDFGDVLVGGDKTLSVKVKNKGTGPLEGVIVGRCFETSEEYTWAPTDMFSVPPDDNLKVAVTYAPTDEGTDEGCLEIVSNDLDESPAVLEVVGTGVESLSEVVDFDIYDFKVKRKIRLGSTQKATPALWVKNTGQLDDSRPAIVMGMQNGVVVYDEELMVSDRGGNQGKTKYRFPSFVPADPGEILWVAVIDDDDEDIDESMAVTQVVGPPTASAGFDLDAAKLKATKRVALSEPQPIRLRAWVMNSGSVDGVGAMTLSGMQAGVEVYREMLSDVSDIPGDGAATRYDFTSFTPIDEGDILWTLSIADGDIDDDVMSAVTRVGP